MNVQMIPPPLMPRRGLVLSSVDVAFYGSMSQVHQVRLRMMGVSHTSTCDGVAWVCWATIDSPAWGCNSTVCMSDIIGVAMDDVW